MPLRSLFCFFPRELLAVWTHSVGFNIVICLQYSVKYACVFVCICVCLCVCARVPQTACPHHPLFCLPLFSPPHPLLWGGGGHLQSYTNRRLFIRFIIHIICKLVYLSAQTGLPALLVTYELEWLSCEHDFFQRVFLFVFLTKKKKMLAWVLICCASVQSTAFAEKNITVD